MKRFLIFTLLLSICEYTFSQDLINGHEYVDLGLPSGTLWATKNIGASIPEEQGYNYAWGELYPSENFWTKDSKNYKVTKYNSNDNLTVLEPEDDVATMMWGSTWKIPTKEDYQELIDNCVVTHDYNSAATAAQMGSKDYVTLKITGQNSNYILLPQSAILASYAGIDITYWTSSSEGTNLAYSYFYQTSTKCNRLQEYERWRSMPIRPISKFVKVKELSILPSLDLNVGESYQLETNITPFNATDPTVVWSSKDETIAKVGPNGRITAIKSGVSEITARTTDGSNLSAICCVSVHNPVTSITLDKNSVTMHVNESLKLQPTCIPIDADDASISWSSSNNSIVTVDNGVIIAIGVGDAVVTASSVNGLSAKCIVTVETTFANSISINKTALELVSGEQETLHATILPSYTTNKKITWKSSAENIAMVSNTGLVKALSTGTAKITATTTDGTEISATCDVFVTTPVVSIRLSKSSETLKVGESGILQAICTPMNADNKVVTWASSKQDIATVSPEGVVTGISRGNATITAIAADGSGVSAKCEVTVIQPVQTISLNKYTVDIKVREKDVLNAICLPDNANNKDVVWSTSNASVATVNNGEVTANAEGTAIVTATTADGTSISAMCTVNVSRHTQEIVWDQDLSSVILGGELLPLTAYTSSGLPLIYNSSNEEVATIFDFGNAIYLNASTIGITDITATQAGNNYYAPVSMTKTVNVYDPAGITDIRTDGKYIIYTLNGLKLGIFTAEEYQKLHLSKGVYIVNGKKMMMKL